jgi:hypothetical protein
MNSAMLNCIFVWDKILLQMQKNPKFLHITLYNNNSKKKKKKEKTSVEQALKSNSQYVVSGCWSKHGTHLLRPMGGEWPLD